ncbi:MAG TPA: hypothetical protein P5181_13800 [Dermatophilaceae bacterium]|nr:hypothetical protein [Dermatophilaceae bacterium]
MTRRTSALALAAGAVALLPLSACTFLGGNNPTPTTTAASQPTTQATTTSARTTSAAPTTAAGTGTSGRAVEVGDPTQAITPPGTKLKLGEPAYLKVESGKPTDEYYTVAIVKVSVVEIRKGTNADFSQLKNASEFAGLTPFYLESTEEVVYFSSVGKYGSPDSISLDPVGGPGARVANIISFGGGIGNCKSTTYERPIVAGATRKPCTVTAAKTGEVIGASYDGSSSSDYHKSPVTWTP